MKTLDEYVESYLNFKSAEVCFIDEICDTLKLDQSRIKSIEMKTVERDTKILQIIMMRLVGENKIRSEDIAKIDGLSIITPNVIEIEVGAIHL